jgi:hypothetical protein
MGPGNGSGAEQRRRILPGRQDAASASPDDTVRLLTSQQERRADAQAPQRFRSVWAVPYSPDDRPGLAMIHK